MESLNLTKNTVLDLSKVSSDLNKLKLSAGWDVNSGLFGSNIDLDLCAILLNKNGKLVKDCNGCVYFGKMKSDGIYLDGDNTTGAGDGDDENIYLELSKLSSDVEKIVFCVVIYQGKSKHQSFSKVKNAYVRLSDVSSREKELCRYNLTEDGGNYTAIKFTELYKENETWQFKAIGEFVNAGIGEIKESYM